MGLAVSKNPILLKYLFSSSRNLGKPIPVKIYSDGKLNEEIKLFKVKKYFNGQAANYDILSFPDSISRNFISIDYKNDFIGLPSSTNERDYKIILGRLFQSDVGAKFTPIDNSIKGFNFDPELNYNSRTIKFKLPKNIFGYDSIRIEK